MLGGNYRLIVLGGTGQRIYVKALMTHREYERMADLPEALVFVPALRPEEVALREIPVFVELYEKEYHQLPNQPPYEMVRCLIVQRELKQADLVSVL